MSDQRVLTADEFERFIKPLADYFDEMQADFYFDIRSIAVEMLDRVGVDSQDSAFWRQPKRMGMYKPGRLTDLPPSTLASIDRIYGPPSFRKAQATTSIKHWPLELERRKSLVLEEPKD